MVPNPGYSGDWDRYAYVRNNPIRYSDPTGHFTADEVCEYWGYCTEEAVREGLGNLFDIIYGTDITWGDLLIYENEYGYIFTAMFVLTAEDIGGWFHFSAGLWKVGGGGGSVGWDQVKGLQQMAGYAHNPKKNTSRLRTVGMSTNDFYDWYGGKDPRLSYGVDDLHVTDPNDYGYSFATYVDLGFFLVSGCGFIRYLYYRGASWLRRSLYRNSSSGLWIRYCWI